MTFKIYYNDNVNEPALLGVKSSLNEAKKMADKEADTRVVGLDRYGKPRCHQV